MNHKGSHLWLMILGCMLPLIVLGAIFLFNISVSTVVLAGLFLFCPLVHLWMMRSGGHGHHHQKTEAELPAHLNEDV